MRRGHGRRPAALGFGAAMIVAVLPQAARAEALARSDLELPIATRVERAFEIVPPDPTTVGRRIEDAFATLSFAAPPRAPAVQLAMATPGPVVTAFAPIGDAPSGGGVFERMVALERTAIAVPLPRHRPEPPVATVRVAALESPVAPAPPVRRDVEPILAEREGSGHPRRIPKEAHPHLALLTREAEANGVPLWLAVGVGWVESRYQPKLRGSHGVLGIMQVMPSTARWMGYKGSTEALLDPETNIVWGMRELGATWRAAKGDACLAIAKYKGGLRTKTISPAAADYCRKAKAITGMV